MKTFRSIFIALLGMVMLSSCVIIRQGEVGVKRRLGKIQETALPEGPRFINPFVATIIKVPIRTVNMEVRLPLPSKEGLTISSEISILYRVQPGSAPLLLREVGKRYESEIIMPVFRSAAADVTSRFLAKDMHSGARAAIEGEIAERMNEILEPRGIVIENVLMKSISLPDGLSNAIEQKLEAEQAAQQMEFIKQREQADAERRIIQATGERDAEILAAEAVAKRTEIEAQGRAKAILAEAEAQAQANEMLQESISEEVLRYRAIEAFIMISNNPATRMIITDGTNPVLGLPADLLGGN